jgi:hypothetical protein
MFDKESRNDGEAAQMQEEWAKVSPALAAASGSLRQAAAKLEEAGAGASKAGDRSAPAIDALAAEALDVKFRLERLAEGLSSQPDPRTAVEAPADE